VNEPLFVLAPPRSFTSVVCAMIGNHPQMLIGALRGMHRARPRLAHGLLRSVAQLGLGGQTAADVEAAERWLEENAGLGTAEVFRDLMAWAGARAVVDKSPMYVYAPGALERIAAAFPEARFLHLSRHPRATCESIHETRNAAEGARGGAVVQGAAAMTPAKMWLKPHQRISEFLDRVPAERKMFMRGETLMAAPGSSLPRIAEWLGVGTTPEAIEAMLHPERSPFACIGPQNARLGNDPHFLQSPVLRPYRERPSDLDSPLSWDAGLTFDEALKACARQFGY
jgi:hypothetical protein